MPDPALSANVASAPEEVTAPELTGADGAGEEAGPDAAGDEAAPEPAGAELVLEPAGAEAAAGVLDAADDSEAELLAADPELLLQAASVSAAAAATAVPTTRVLAFMGVLLEV
ncbi:MAG: hypothetical protein M3Y35_12740 [Actinomycetota bacterium]|nr:hypothetical protein [Actinomycetota bacterium]